MFFPCPHCQFLVAHHPQLRPLPADCPRCGRPLQEDIDASPEVPDGTTRGQVQDTGDAGDNAGDALPGSGDGDSGYPSREQEPAADHLVVQAVAATAAAIATPVDAEGSAHGESTGEDAATEKEQATVDSDANATDAGAASDAAPAATATFAAQSRRHGWSRWRWPLIVLLAFALALQILLADRARLAEDPRWRPLLETVCGVLHCSLPTWHEPAAFTMLDRKVRPASHAPGALRVDATFRNDARWPQAWPALQLALSDADGRVLGSRVLQPQEYLGAAPEALLSPGQSAQITFMVQEPAPGTVAFAFEFR